MLADHTAGNPCDCTQKWTELSVEDIQARMSLQGVEGSLYLVRQMLKTAGFKRRKLHKAKCMGEVENRNVQFEYIAQLKAAFLARGLPVLSIDSKKKELLGDFYREGTHYGQVARQVNDHDFPSLANGQIVPHGIYDLGKNYGYITLGTSKDTSAFVCDNIEHFWINELQWHYPDTNTILVLCDGGGANNCRHYRFKQDLWLLAQRLQINIVVAHYPAYCSKWNPIEHRLFCHLTRAWNGAVFSNISHVKELALKTATSTGLEVSVRINSKVYQTNRKYNFEFKHYIERFIQFADKLPKWNYAACYNKT